jgi:ABC-type uncharacterized transport system substrate-binding protein
MRRREFIKLLLGSLAGAPRATFAQPSSRVYRLGSINPALPLAPQSPFGKILVDALAQRGYVIGQNLIYDSRGAMGDDSKIPELMAALKDDHVEVVVGVGYPAATGLIDSLARPGGNVTGISDLATTLTTKRLGLLKAFSPTLRRVAMLRNKDDLGMTMRYQASAQVAQSSGIAVQPLGVREPDDLDEAFAAMNKEPPDAILMVADALTVLNRKRVFDFAANRRLPAIYEYSFLVRDGGLMS